MKHLVKRIVRALGALPQPLVKQETFNEFFAHPCWLAIRMEAARRLDAAADVAYQSEEIKEICKMRGVMQGLMFILQGEEYIRHIIAEDQEASTAEEERAEELLELMEKQNHG